MASVFTCEQSLCPYTLFETCFITCLDINLFSASQIPIALDMAKDSNGKDKDLKKRIDVDDYMSRAVEECYASFRNIINFLVQGNREKQ